MRSVLVAFFLFAPAAPIAADELAAIERRITKEPEYTAQPYYALLAFGERATTRVWLVVDGETVYIDRNANGDLTDPGERVELDVEATKNLRVGGSGEYTGMNIFDLGLIEGTELKLNFWVRDDNFDPPANEPEILSEYRKQRKANGWQNATLWRVTSQGGQAQNPVVLAPRAEYAQISHLNGPRTFARKWEDRTAINRSQPFNFDVHIGSPGLPTRNCTLSVFSPLTTQEVPSNVHPVAVFVFPHKSPDKPPIEMRLELNQRC